MFRNDFMGRNAPPDMCKCQKPEFTNGECADCFAEAMERKIRQGIRATPIRKGSALWYTHPLCREMLKRIIGNLPITEATNSAAADTTILDWTADDELAAFCDALFNGKPLPQFGSIPAEIKLFVALTDQEVGKLATRCGIPWQPHGKPSTYAQIEKLSAKYPELKSSLGKSVAELREVLGKNI